MSKNRSREDRRNRHNAEQAIASGGVTTEAVVAVTEKEKPEVKEPVVLTETQTIENKLKGMTKRMSRTLGFGRHWIGDTGTPMCTVQIKEKNIIKNKAGELIDNIDIVQMTLDAHLDEADRIDEAVYCTLNLRNAQGKMQDCILTSVDDEKRVAYVSFDTYQEINASAAKTIMRHARAAEGGVARAGKEADPEAESDVDYFDS